jgi:trimethylamine:corrinoid methyltransferase-like protein
MAQRVRAKVKHILQHHEPLPIPRDVEAQLRDSVAQADQLYAG